MVSLRCILVVKEELRKLGIKYASVNLGEVEIFEKLTGQQIETLRLNLKNIGLELLEDKRNILINKIKNEVITLIHHSDSLLKVNFSDHLSTQLGYDYTYLSNLFSDVMGITIQQFIIFNKIEKVKELLLYNELNLTEISYKLDYSSVSHLSNQFKKVTGLTPSYFKQMKELRRAQIK
ncbi:helix-turn-helix domain-containing protein [Pararhodonellum marinum]|uniref:helix-turn-helix domain-containing protein n=1 Tax=Pararhodonellum marinum TaxID=2755358 RepID=UPI00188FC9DD|nr:AraC family transcriptional regulator [Pararhodonellum marinum]